MARGGGGRGALCGKNLVLPPALSFSCTSLPPPSPPQRDSGLWHVCTGGNQHKAQKENGPVSGLQDHRYLLSEKMGHEDASGQTIDRCKAVDMQRYPPPPRAMGPRRVARAQGNGHQSMRYSQQRYRTATGAMQFLTTRLRSAKQPLDWAGRKLLCGGGG